ncbi:MAG TPA: SDR family oxidoreductase, partial [Geobacteraceae bacterium]
MDLMLDKRMALVTGSTKGIGFAVARALAGEGAWVIVTGRSEASVAEAVDAIRSVHPGTVVEGYVGDLAAATGAEGLVRRFPSVDILVNNLGMYEPKPFEEITDAEWLRIFEVNVLSAVRLSRA